MPTPNFVPRESGEGLIGTTNKPWSGANFSAHVVSRGQNVQLKYFVADVSTRYALTGLSSGLKPEVGDFIYQYSPTGLFIVTEPSLLGSESGYRPFGQTLVELFSNPTIYGTVTLSSGTTGKILYLDTGLHINYSTIPESQLQYLSGLTGNIQAQFTGLAPLNSPVFVVGITTPQIRVTGQTPSTVPYFDSSGQLVSSAVTSVELNFLSGATGNIQVQLNNLNTNLTGTTPSGTLYVSLNGNDMFGLRNRADKPFFTLSGAKSAAQSGDLIFVGPGRYYGKNLLKHGVNWFFDQGAIVDYSGAGSIFDDTASGTSGAVVCSIGGYGRFYHSNTGNTLSNCAILELNNANTDITMTCLELANMGTLNGGNPVTILTQGNAKLTIDVKERIYSKSYDSMVIGQTGSNPIYIRAREIISETGVSADGIEMGGASTILYVDVQYLYGEDSVINQDDGTLYLNARTVSGGPLIGAGNVYLRADKVFSNLNLTNTGKIHSIAINDYRGATTSLQGQVEYTVGSLRSLKDVVASGSGVFRSGVFVSGVPVVVTSGTQTINGLKTFTSDVTITQTLYSVGLDIGTETFFVNGPTAYINTTIAPFRFQGEDSNDIIFVNEPFSNSLRINTGVGAPSLYIEAGALRADNGFSVSSAGFRVDSTGNITGKRLALGASGQRGFLDIHSGASISGVTGANVVQTFGEGDFDDANACSLIFTIYPFTYFGGTRFYGTGFIKQFNESGSASGAYYVTLTWSSVPGASGYKVVVTDECYQGFFNDAYFSGTGTSLLYGDGNELNGISQIPMIVTPLSTGVDLYVNNDGGLISRGSGSFGSLNSTDTALTNFFYGPVKIVATNNFVTGSTDANFHVSGSATYIATMRLEGSYAKMQMVSAAAPANNGHYQFYVSDQGLFNLGLLNDTDSSESLFFRITRSGTTGINIWFNTGIKMGLAVSSPQANLHIGAGGTGFPPLRINSGALTTTAVSGAMEYNGAFYITNTGGIRGAITTGGPYVPLSGGLAYATLVSGATGLLTIDFSGNRNQQVDITTSGSYQFSGQNYPGSGFVSDIMVYLNNSATGTSALTFPSNWLNLGASWPTGIASGKVAMLWFRAIDTGSTIVGTYNVRL